MRLVFLRHGESEYNLSGLCNADPAVRVRLTELGRQQAGEARERLRHEPIRRVYVSRLQRAQETAAIVCGGLCPDIHVDARLDDRNSGYEGLPVAEYMRAMQAAPDPFHWKAPGGESYLEMVARVQGFLTELAALADNDAQMVLVVTHHEVLQAVTGYFERLDPARMWRVWVGNCDTLEYEMH